jgi:trans-2,3-dihydro-3-hydroxyanthranilate isomerase
MFAPHLGVEEDPATGSATGCLAAYLSKTRYLGSDSVNAVSEQGASVKRPSILRLRADPREGVYNVSVGGRSRIVADGQIDIA